MRACTATIRLHMKKALQYRVEAVSGFFTQVFFGFMQISLYSVFLSQGQDTFTVVEMASYIWLQQALLTVLKYYDTSKQEITNQILNGDISYQIIRPIDLYNYWYSINFAKPIGSFTLRGIPMLIMALFLPAGYGLMIPSITNFLMFLVSLTIAVMLVVAINTFFHIIVLHTMSATGIFSFAMAIGALLSGMVIPIPMLPESVQMVFNFFPFRYITDLPFRIYIGNISGLTALWQMGIQVVWFIFFLVLGKILLKAKLKRLVVQGG